MPLLYHVDAFADRPFAGNPAAVVLLDQPAGEAWMQQVAAEMNLAETAFVTEADPASAGGTWGLRWFSPAAEVELCGHATLAAAHVLWQAGRAPAHAPIHFQTRYRGTLACRAAEPGPQTAQGACDDNSDGEPSPYRGRSALITMTFPSDVPVDTTAPAELLEALRLPSGVTPINVARARYDWIIELPRPDHVRSYQPDFPALSAIDCRGIALTARTRSTGSEASAGADRDLAAHDIVSRFFAPRLRINEDPVTGSLHCALGPYWSPRLGRRTLRCHQASARGGDLRVTSYDDHVELAGRAITIARGELLVKT